MAALCRAMGRFITLPSRLLLLPRTRQMYDSLWRMAPGDAIDLNT